MSDAINPSPVKNWLSDRAEELLRQTPSSLKFAVVLWNVGDVRDATVSFTTNVETHDLNGNPYARLSDLKAGSVVTTDEDFDCRVSGVSSTVQADENGELFIPCIYGKHFLEGQLQDEGDVLIGVYHAEATPG